VRRPKAKTFRLVDFLTGELRSEASLFGKLGREANGALNQPMDAML